MAAHNDPGAEGAEADSWILVASQSSPLVSSGAGTPLKAKARNQKPRSTATEKWKPRLSSGPHTYTYMAMLLHMHTRVHIYTHRSS